MRILIRGGRVIDPASSLDEKADVLIEDGRIAAVGTDLEAGDARRVDAEGLVVAPGLVDMHVHFREPGQEYKEDIASGSRAAAAGGVTSCACMPNTDPVIDNEALVSRTRQRGEEVGICRVYPVAAITKGLAGERLTEMKLLERAGAVGFSDDGLPVTSARMMRRALEYSQITDVPVMTHAEERTLSAGGHMHEGLMSTKLGIPGIPAAAEEIAIDRDIRLAEMTKGRLHVCHVSTAGAVELIRDAKERGVDVTAEGTPHHFTLTDEAVSGFDPNTKMNPPLRTEEDRRALCDALRDGTIDAIATDHAPHARREKLVEYDKAPFGIIGLETSLALAITTLVESGNLTLPQVIEKMSTVPARILGLAAGTLGTGQPADVIVFDPEKRWIFTEADIRSKSRNTPFLGRELTGRVLLTLVGGKAVYSRPEIEERQRALSATS